jgi:hypothetical protein
MSRDQQAEIDERFPSGPWIGYWQQDTVQARQRLGLTFAQGTVKGSGRDVIGDFLVHGTYDATTGGCSLVKRYPSHAVHYEGLADGDGIGGKWTIRQLGFFNDAGGFRIWPDEACSAEANVAEAEVVAPG